MNYSFLEPLGDFAFRSVAIPVITPTPTELDNTWREFEKTLGAFKTKYAKARANVTASTARLTSAQHDINVLDVSLKVVRSGDLKETVSQVVEDYKKASGYDDIITQLSDEMGEAEAMKRILMDTNAERYARFTCFVCMDSVVDSLLDPCNHVICERCWIRSRNSACPGCRTEVREVRRIFTLS